MADSVIRVRFRFRTVDNLNNDYEGFCVDDVNVTGILTPQYTISGFIKNDCNLPVSGVVVDANNGGGSAPADANGRYEIAVNYGWSGTVTPSRLNYTFEPNLIGYNNVLTDIPDQNYVAVYIYDLNRNCTIGWGDVAVFAENWLQTGNGIAGDFDADNYVDFIDFAEFALIW